MTYYIIKNNTISHIIETDTRKSLKYPLVKDLSLIHMYTELSTHLDKIHKILCKRNSVLLLNNAPVAQRIEYFASDEGVVGSSPAGRTKYGYTLCETERNGVSQCRASFQQKTMPDHKNPGCAGSGNRNRDWPLARACYTT